MQRRGSFFGVLLLSVAGLLFTGCGNLFNAGEDSSSSVPRGFDTLGRGYDVTRSYARPSEILDSRILDLDSLESDGLLNRRVIDQGETEVISGESLDEYRTALSSSVSVGGSYKAFSGSVSAGFSQNSLQQFGQKFATVRSVVRQDKLFIDGDYNAADLSSYLTDRFRERINDLDTSPESIFRNYGTHVITSIFTGGRLEYSATVNESLIATSRSFGAVAEAAFGVKFLEVDAAAEFASEQEESSYNRHAETRVNVYPAGSSSIDVANAQDYRAWQDAVNESNDGLLSAFDPNGLIPVWEFAEEQSRKDAILVGFEEWLRRAEESIGLAEYERETMSVSFSAYGGWPLVGGDADMDIDGGLSNDTVPVTARIRLSVSDDDHLVIELTFDIREDGGDGTHFSGVQTQRFRHTNPGTIVGLSGVTSCDLSATATGGNGRTGTFASGQCELGMISWRADRDGDDQNYVGLSGTLQVPIIVRPE